MAEGSLFFSNLYEMFVFKRWSCYQGSILASYACGHHLLAFEGDQKIFDFVLKPIFDNAPKYNVEDSQIKVVDDDTLPNEDLMPFDCE